MKKTKTNEKLIGFNIPIFKLNLLNIEKSKCPVNNFTANRTPKVKGRILKLIISIKFNNGINTKGLPIGVKCEKKPKTFLKKLEETTKIIKARAKLMVEIILVVQLSL